ncbi:Cysteine proteinases superfamily protein [Raphanus sativus]|uniref:KDEL-tailed cysteine endopeptidase CEP3-like n=1 Tax=Raphanus sativus TaxID=3726 RepID=A0A6J0MQN0_RAPSA|nr:KDEL-tailed cysteine endopeptidase CEP3-like [Raphanus sativus]KAJ4867739.1 Cysteine proteinases superfamily protein [Raphanus sativus]KAJ4907768.1 Cysteine proteinases superfamily protein [Raphanus sativus]
MDKRKRSVFGEDPQGDVAKEAPETKHERDQDANRSYGAGGGHQKRGKKPKTGDASTTKSTHRLTPSDDDYPKDCGDDGDYFRDWSDTDRVLREVNNQGTKDTCWAHSTTKNLEAVVKIKFNRDVSLSVKHLFHGITKKMSNDAVKNLEEIRTFLKNEGTIQEKDCECEKRTEKKDPCAKKIKEKTVGVLKIDDLVITKMVKEEDLIRLLKISPVMASIHATNEFKDHRGPGIFYGDKKSKAKTLGDHLVLVTGYNTINGEHYWIIQNTWGVTWGEKGFGKIARKISRGKGQQSLFSEIVYPTVSGIGGLA